MKTLTALILTALLAACGGGEVEQVAETTASVPESEICKDSTKAWTWAYKKHCLGDAQ